MEDPRLTQIKKLVQELVDEKEQRLLLCIGHPLNEHTYDIEFMGGGDSEFLKNVTVSLAKYTEVVAMPTMIPFIKPTDIN